MNYSQRQDIRISQQFALTTQMRHSIQILGMSLSDLNEYIDTVLSTNPLLEKDKPEDSPFKTKLDTPNRRNLSSYELPEDTDIEQQVTPQQDLLAQIRTLDLDEKELEVAEYLIYEIDGNGYLKVDSEEAASDLMCDPADVEEMVGVIQSLDPPGIGARDIRECLQIQLQRKGKKGTLEYEIVSEHLSLLAVNDTISISRALHVDKKEILEAIQNIKTLNPHPASSSMARSAQPVVPDLIATLKNKKIRLEINRGSIPKLKIYNPYSNEMDIVKDPEAKDFLQKNTRAANQLLDNLKRREETLCRVAYHILQVQQRHIEEEKPYIEVLTMQDLSKALNLNVSTISRAISNKHIQINNKVVPLKSLISNGFNSTNGDQTSKTYVKALLRKIVESEDKSSPLGDAEIEKELSQQGINIKRRTIAKYRESMKILPTYLRKKVTQ